MIPRALNRRGFLISALAATGCGGPATAPDRVWGKRGVQPGDLVRPRAIAILPNDHVYVVDFTARIQGFDADGKYLGITWQTPDYRNGRPSGLSVTRDGNVIVSDSHYATVRIYSPQGEELSKLGGVSGDAPGQFIYISDAVQTADGGWYISEFGGNERITRLDAAGNVVRVWGQRGNGNGEFAHIRALAWSNEGLLYVADAGNHRIQVFDCDGNWFRNIGSHGSGPGELAYPYDVCLGARGNLYVVEHGNHRVQKLTSEGKPLTQWGGPGRTPGKLYNPWALAVDSRDRVQIVDTENHRVQRVRL